MVKYIETSGRTEEDAISAALIKLGLERYDVSIEVVERAKSGFFGFGSNPAKVRVSYEVEYEGGKPLPIGYSAREDVLASARKETAPKPAPEAKQPEPKPVQKAEPAAEPKPVEKPVEKAPEAPAAPAPEKAAPEVPAPAETKAPEVPASAPAEKAPEEPKPVEEETILAAKPGWQPARGQKQGRGNHPKQGGGRGDSRRRDQGRRQGRGGPRDGDEVIVARDIPIPPQPAERPVHHEPILSPVAEDDEKAIRIREFLNGLMEHLHVQAQPEIMITDEGNYKVKLVGENLGAIIGRRGETLDAIQQLTSYAVNRGAAKRVRIHVDAEGYRAKREESLKRLAEKTAAKVVRSRRNLMLEPMNAYERHVIHTALQDYPNVTTYSTGVEPNRRTIIAYAPAPKQE